MDGYRRRESIDVRALYSKIPVLGLWIGIREVKSLMKVINLP